MFEIQSLNHVNMVVRDVEASKRFYCDVLGMEDVPRHPSFTFPGAWLRSGSAEIHLIQEDVATHAPGDLSYAAAAITDKDLAFSRHFSLVIDDTDALVEQLQALDVDIAFGPVERLGGLVQTYCYDLDGHLIEFTQSPTE
ncbi:MAG: VOC family protein [Anaerolineae bacterium]|jgi:catechol 2,3-dioxygenase-like lactoylglutathione lyase family enzyme